MSLKGKQVYARKTGNKTPYKWAPDTSIKKQKLDVTAGFEGCTARAFEVNGIDNNVTYVIKRGFADNEYKNYAYVACDYVQ